MSTPPTAAIRQSESIDASGPYVREAQRGVCQTAIVQRAADAARSALNQAACGEVDPQPPTWAQFELIATMCQPA